ncbi:MAG TPA: prepilin-type N-terminal cleavage/methylation domain-containing protein [Gemmatimonadaceae bacterium]|nr:prepilin-type N-terminal cleavage/methylation domain-containing protein [Gemmatimonadaceae bacterium]
MLIELRSRAGFTLIELLVTLAVGSIVAGSVAGILLRQQRTHIGLSAIVERRTQLRHATNILEAAVRDAAPAEGDVVARSDSSLDFLAPLGAGVMCDTLPARAGVVLAPDSVSAGYSFGFQRDTPRAGDVLFVLSEGPSDAGSDDAWESHVVAGVGRSIPPCPASPLLHPVLDAGRAELSIAFAAGDALGAGVRMGAPVRFARRARFRFYRSGGDWWLGRSDLGAAGWASVQPVSGPYRSYAVPGGPTGIAFAWFDTAGIALPPLSGAATLGRLTITARTRTTRSLAVPGMRRGPYDDSLAMHIALRNVP